MPSKLRHKQHSKIILIWWCKTKLTRFLKSRKRPNLRKTFRLLMFFLTSINLPKLWLHYQLQEIRITRWKMMKLKKKVTKIRIKQTQHNRFSKTKGSIKTLQTERTNLLASI